MSLYIKRFPLDVQLDLHVPPHLIVHSYYLQPYNFITFGLCLGTFASAITQVLDLKQ